MTKAERAAPRPIFLNAWADFTKEGRVVRLIAVVFLGTMAFSMQDVLLEPYGGEILGLSVSSTTLLTAMWASGALVAFALAARWLAKGQDPFRMAGNGILVGILAFTAVVFAAPLMSIPVFFAGAVMIGFGSGLFAVSMLTSAMTLPVTGAAGRGLALGAWGAAQATGAGLSIFLGGSLRDLINTEALAGVFGPTLANPTTGYATVYLTEIILLFITLIVLGPLVRARVMTTGTSTKLELAEFPT